MPRVRWLLLAGLVCLPAVVLATRVPLPLVDAPLGRPRPAPVADPDFELAYLHTTTNGTTWERFVAGMLKAGSTVPGLSVDASSAFLDRTTAVPEVVLTRAGSPNRLRVRWYKLSSEQTTADWVAALAERSPPPLALVGGGSSDRAADLARAMAARGGWRGPKPLLFITTATADDVAGDGTDRPLIDVYPDRTFRFCFTNRQMAAAVLDFVWGRPDLRPGVVAGSAKPHAFCPVWADDPFSRDLARCFQAGLANRAEVSGHRIAFSVGGFSRPNRDEAAAADGFLRQLAELTPQRSLLVLPTITQPARRLLRALTEANPQLAGRLVAVTGDGIPVNALYRDGEFAWPVHALPVPLVLFAHADPLAWDADPADDGSALRPPNSTEDVLLFADLVKVVTASALTVDPLTADGLRERLHAATPAFFDPAGNRLGNTGEHVCVLLPQFETGNAGRQTLPRGVLEVWQRAADGWAKARAEPIDQRRLRSLAARPAGGRG